MSNLTYVLVTPAKNEAKYIPETIKSVTTQKIKPLKWVIVNDGSTDGTEKIVLKAARQYPYIKLISRTAKSSHSFESVVRAIEYGIQHISVKKYAFIGLIDADVQFRSDYFFLLMKKMESKPTIGLAGGMVVDITTRRQRVPRNKNDVPGATQFFRKECFEAIGPLIPVAAGGWDMLTCAKARMVGFETRLYPDLMVKHLKPRNASQGSLLKRVWNMGVRDYALGYHPVFETLKCIDRIREPPMLFGAFIWLMGYSFAFLTRKDRNIPKDILEFIRKEQLQRIREIFC